MPRCPLVVLIVITLNQLSPYGLDHSRPVSLFRQEPSAFPYVWPSPDREKDSHLHGGLV